MKKERIILGEGVPWFNLEWDVFSDRVYEHSIKFIDKDGMGVMFNRDFNYDDLCNGKTYRLILEEI